MSVETALRRIRKQAALLSLTMRLAETDGEPLDEGAAEGISDVCDDMAELAGRVARTLDSKTHNLELAERIGEEPHGFIILADAKGRRKPNRQVRKPKAKRKVAP